MQWIDKVYIDEPCICETLAGVLHIHYGWALNLQTENFLITKDVRLTIYPTHGPSSYTLFMVQCHR